MMCWGGKPSDATLAFNWARIIETMYASERLLELATDKDITSKGYQNHPHRHLRGGGWLCRSTPGDIISSLLDG